MTADRRDGSRSCPPLPRRRSRAKPANRASSAPRDRPAHEAGASELSARGQVTRSPVRPLREARVVAQASTGEAADPGGDRLGDDNATAPSLALKAESCAKRSAGCPWLDDGSEERTPQPRARRGRAGALERETERQRASPVDCRVL